MGGFSIWHWLIVIAIVLLLFGGNKLSSIMGDAAKGIRAFKDGLKDDETGPKEGTSSLPRTDAEKDKLNS